MKVFPRSTVKLIYILPAHEYFFGMTQLSRILNMQENTQSTQLD